LRSVDHSAGLDPAPVLLQDVQHRVVPVGDVVPVVGIGDGAQVGAVDPVGLIEQYPLTRPVGGLFQDLGQGVELSDQTAGIPSAA
jgi:hypothetical protein